MPALPAAFFRHRAAEVAPRLIGCRLVKRLPSGGLLWGVIVETEAYCQSEPACHGHRRRSPQNETLFGEPGQWYVYLSYGIHHCVNVVTERAEWASGVLLRAVALPGEPERVAAGPALLARRFGIDRRYDRQPLDPALGLWLAPRPAALEALLGWDQRAASEVSVPNPPGDGLEAGEGRALLQTTRIGISQGQDLPWRWYLRASRSVSRRARGDRAPSRDRAWTAGED